ncbi:L-dopachrome tautomerase-related protein [Paraburkholderia metrosideri]|uniref:L-dopachrome tautomerase-related protein n=1 Tax=Paraburkholderia metrosideri TaxID=580937 RepID=A0ABW9E463_9BURK
MAIEMQQVAESFEFLWNGAVCAPNGRLFASMPGWLGPTPGVVEIFPDGTWKPFPGNEWNGWALDKDPTHSFVDVNSIFADDRGSLWVLDAAAPFFATAIEGAVKLVEISLETNEVKRVIVFDPKDAHSGTRLAHIRFSGDHAFMAESKEGSFYVIDLRDNSYRRILVGHPLMRCLPDDVPTMEGRRIHLRDGRPMYIHNDLLEFGTDPNTLYFMCLFGSRIFKTHVDTFKDPTLSDDEIASHISVAYEVGPWIAGMCRDMQGNIYLSDAENNGMSVLRPDGSITPILRDDQIIWPISPSVGPDGYLYFPATQLNRIPMFSGGEDKVERPWKIFKVKVSEAT